MKLSGVYDCITLYALVYHTQPGSKVVELITHRFFNSEKKAWKWFHRKRQVSQYIEPEVVPVTGFGKLELEDKQAVCALR